MKRTQKYEQDAYSWLSPKMMVDKYKKIVAEEALNKNE